MLLVYLKIPLKVSVWRWIVLRGGGGRKGGGGRGGKALIQGKIYFSCLNRFPGLNQAATNRLNGFHSEEIHSQGIYFCGIILL